MTTTNHLLRVLGLAFGLAAVVGSIVGQGILRSPGIVAQASDSPAILIGLWIMGALAALISALAFTELAAAIPSAGGPMAYVERAFGRRAGVVMAITVLLAYVSATAILCFVVGEFLVRLGVGQGRFGPGAMGAGSLALFCLVNAAGTRVSGVTQIALSSAKGAVLMALVLVLFAQPDAAPAATSVPAVASGWIPVGVAMLVIVGTYNGWADLVIYGEEIENPGRAIPRAMFGGIAGVTTLYLLVNLALLHVLSPAAMAGSEFVAADAAGGVFGRHGNTVFTAFGVLSVGAIANLSVMTNSRLVFAAARDGILPRWLAAVGSRGTPIRAMIASAACAGLFLVSGTYLALSSTSVSLSQAIYVVVILSAMALRRSEPDLPRPFRAPLFPWSMVLALAINGMLLAVFIAQDPFYALLGFALVGGLSALYALLAGKGAPPAVPLVAGAET
jgi:APA family basic amino acid/polyamine antiporter